MLRIFIFTLMISLSYSISNGYEDTADTLSEDNIIIIDSLSDIGFVELRAGETIIYRLPVCEDSNDICSLVMSAFNSLGLNNKKSMRFTMYSTSQSYVCEIRAENLLGNTIGRIINRNSATFSGTVDFPPFSWNSFPNVTYTSGFGYYWTSQQEKTHQPPGITNLASGYSYARGTLNALGPVGTYEARHNINSISGYTCVVTVS